MKKPAILFYAIPAYGHIHSNLYLAGRLSGCGFRVIYYSTEPFRSEIEANGGEYRAYPLKRPVADLSDGSRILRLYRLLLENTWDMLPSLLEEAGQIKPCAVIFDSLALWGRMAGELLSVPSFSFYSIAAIDRIGHKAFMEYAAGFSAGFLRYAGELFPAVKMRRRLMREYGYGGRRLGLFNALMNKGDYNLMGYSKRFQPGGEKFGEEYIFLGPLSMHRTGMQSNDFVFPGHPLIYISLGTIFNQDDRLLREILRQFGRGKGRNCQVVMAWDLDRAGKDREAVKRELASFGNFTVRPFLNQCEVLRQADLFISAGGLNSIHEALYFGVPSLLCPQQGEQRLNAKRFEALGFGRLLSKPENLYSEAVQAIRLKESWDDTLRLNMTAERTDAVMQLFQKLAAMREEV